MIDSIVIADDLVPMGTMASALTKLSIFKTNIIINAAIGVMYWLTPIKAWPLDHLN